MPGRKGGMVYHWKHGYIPLDHYAALQKAHGSQIGAARIMQRHDIHDGPKSLHSVDLSNGGKGKPSAPSHADVKSTHPVGATVKASQPGIDNQTHGKVVGHTPTGMVLVSHTGHNGKPLVGTFNPAHTHVVGSGATTHEAHPAPHTLKPGEHATVRGTDEYGQPATYTGKVMANGEVSSFSKGRTTGGQPLRSISVERQDGSRRSNVVYVPDPNRGEQKRGDAKANADRAKRDADLVARTRAAQPAAARQMDRMRAEEGQSRAKVRDLPAEGNFSRSHSETFMGEKITVHKTAQGQHETLINGEPLSAGYGSRNKDAVKALDEARKSIETMKAPGADPKYRGMYGMKSASPATREERNAEQVARTRAAQPVAARQMDNMTRATQLRAAAAKKRAEADRIANGAGVNDRAAAMLSGKTHARQVAKDDSALRRFSEKQREAKALESMANAAEGRAKTAAEKQAAADLGVTAAQMSRGDMIQHKGSVHMVTKVNRTTVSVPSIVGGSWEDKLSIGQVSKHVKVADMKESTLRTLMSRAKGNAGLQAVYMAELKRRGLAS